MVISVSRLRGLALTWSSAFLANLLALPLDPGGSEPFHISHTILLLLIVAADLPFRWALRVEKYKVQTIYRMLYCTKQP